MGKNKHNIEPCKQADSSGDTSSRQSAKVITKAILITVSALLLVIVSLFVLFNFLSPTSPTKGDPSYALSSSTTYYKNGDNFYTLTSSTPHYKCTNSRHPGTNDYLTSSVSGTCYTYSGYYSHSCSKVYGTHTSLSASAYGNHVWEMGGLAVFHDGYKYADAEYTEHYASSRSGTVGAYYWECDTCGATTSGHWYDSGAHSWGQCQMTREALYVCSNGCGKMFEESVFKSQMCPTRQIYLCEYCGTDTTGGDLYTAQCGSHVTQYTCADCNTTVTSTSATGCTNNFTGNYKCSYCSNTFSSNSTAGCSERPYSGSARHSISLNYTNYVYTDIDTGSQTTTTTAYSTATGYTVSYDANGGSGTMANQYFLHSRAQNLTANTFTRTNYKFKGWATSSTGAVTYSNQQSLNLSSVGNITLYANWELQQFTITLDNQSATTPGSTSVTATYGAAMPSITVPAKNGYTFGGYYTSTGGSGTQYYTASGASAKTCDLTSATTLYAKWTANTYNITLTLNGGSGVSSSTYTVSTSSQTKTIANPTRTGYQFAGWTVSCSGGSPTISGTTLTIPANCYNGITLSTKWTANTYTVAYNANGGTGTTASSTHTYGTAKNLTANAFARTGYTFSGWATSASGAKVYDNSASVTNLTATNGATVNLFAAWQVVTVTISFDAGDADFAGTTAVNVSYGANLPTITTPMRAGYTFKGYFVGNDKIFNADGTPVATTSTYLSNVSATANFVRWFEVVSVTGSTTSYTVQDSADANLKNSILMITPASGHIITSISFDNENWCDITKCEAALLNPSVAVGVTYYASTGSAVLVLEFDGIITPDVKIYLKTAAGSYTSLSAA